MKYTTMGLAITVCIGLSAGALIGRIDNGLPFGIGDQASITIPASGLLYLGTNDDNVSDDSGQFQVIISSSR